MKLEKVIIIILTSFFFSPNIGAYPIIRISLKQLLDPDHVMTSMKKSTATSKYTLHGLHKYYPAAGVFAMYAGFLNNSDHNGQIIFPLKHKTHILYVIITELIEPITMFGNTIHHWEVIPGTPALFFKCELTQNDAHKEQYWTIEQIALPGNNIIPLEAIVIISNPRYVTIPTGISIASKGPNIILPDIYIKKGINIVKNAAYILNMRHLFGNVILNRQKQPTMHQLSIDQ